MAISWNKRMRVCLLVCLALALLPLPAMAVTKVQEVTTPGGLKAWLIEEHSLPLITLKISFRNAGYAQDLPGKQGLADMTSNLLFEGAGPYKATEYQAELEKKAIRMGLDAGDDLFMTTTSTLSENKDRAFEMIGLALTAPRLDTDAFDRVQKQMISRVSQLEEDPSFIASTEWHTQAYPNHPYGFRGTGSVESLRKLTREDVKDFIAHNLTKDNVVIAVVGDIDAKTLAPLLDKALAGLPAKAETMVAVPDRMPDTNKLIFRRNKSAQSVVLFSAPAIMRNDPHYYDAYVMNEILGGGEAMSSRLFTEIREKRGLAYTASSQLDSSVHSSILFGGFSTRHNEVDKAVDVFRQTLKTMQEKGITEAELKDAKNYLTGTFPLRLDNNGSLASFLISMQVYDLGMDFLDKRNEYVNAVTLDGVNKMANALLSPDKFVTVVVGNPTKLPEGATEVK